ncbi:hypothetical protein JOQ06_007406 [Pogonophryne albipinna]|uniref:Uncharacterized protein n=1 Tax=Pogonophryne albipinna TaxID=1090488 RepID=A0AAD6AYW8_9TELE|nr:hypothetical protein JOQ06_007406 [Pogonophryne albipinna]
MPLTRGAGSTRAQTGWWGLFGTQWVGGAEGKGARVAPGTQDLSLGISVMQASLAGSYMCVYADKHTALQSVHHLSHDSPVWCRVRTDCVMSPRLVGSDERVSQLVPRSHVIRGDVAASAAGWAGALHFVNRTPIIIIPSHPPRSETEPRPGPDQAGGLFISACCLRPLLIDSQTLVKSKQEKRGDLVVLEM